MDRDLSTSDETKTGGNAAAAPPSFLKWILPFLVGIPLLWAVWLACHAFIPVNGGPVTVVIPQATGLARIEKILAAHGVIRGNTPLVILAAITGKGRRLKAGEYLFPAGRTPLQVLDLLVSGRVLYRPVTIPEGMNQYQVADILARDGWVDRDRFLARCRDPGFIRKLGLDVNDLEGYLFPDTYLLSRGQQDEGGIIRLMVAGNQRVLARLLEQYPQENGMSRHQILTLASIVEKETGRPGERPLVARVFLNRLRLGMRLQADPTVRYGLLLSRKEWGRLTRQDLEQPTPYNTYLIKGLPPGPICNPGRAAIAAVLAPATESYLYFVARNDGSHYFSRSLAEHNRAVARYQKTGR
ncbi:MAG: endolytic transglycosylase MltG [Desulfobacterales bacterium]|nr:endolytic transglycosylase MltG [Desulfobacterales bacterium]